MWSIVYIVDMARKFPIGIQTFSEIRKMNAIYVDKTALVHKLAEDGKVYFLALPAVSESLSSSAR